MTISLNYLLQGVIFKDLQNQGQHLYIRLNEEQSHLEYCKVVDINNFEKGAKTVLQEPQKGKPIFYFSFFLFLFLFRFHLLPLPLPPSNYQNSIQYFLSDWIGSNDNAVNVIDIADLQETTTSPSAPVSSFLMKLKTGNKLSLASETRIEFVYFFDGLRCLIGMAMQTREMQVWT